MLTQRFSVAGIVLPDTWTTVSRYPYAPPETKRQQEATGECYSKTSAHINEIYSYINDDGGFDGDQMQRAVLECLIDRGLAPKDTTYDEFVADLNQGDGQQFNPEGGPNEEEIQACWIEMTT